MAEYVTKIRTNQGDKQIDYAALANLPDLNNMFSNPNLLINSDFRNPVNQRGKTSYTGTNSATLYTVDRWGIVNVPTVTVQDDSLKIENPSTATYTGRFKQVFENSLPSDFYTLSMKIKSNTANVEVSNFGKIYSGFSGVYSRTSAVKLELNELVFYISPGGGIEIEWIKLECGKTATPFVPRLYAEELMLCRRYYRNDSVRLISYQHTNTYAYFGYNYEPMRVAPTFYYEGFAETSNHAGTPATSTAVQALEGTAISRMAIRITFNDTSTAYYRCASGRIKLDAEIY